MNIYVQYNVRYYQSANTFSHIEMFIYTNVNKKQVCMYNERFLISTHIFKYKRNPTIVRKFLENSWPITGPGSALDKSRLFENFERVYVKLFETMS